MSSNIYAPQPARIRSIKDEAEGVKSFILEFEDPKQKESFYYCPGQFIEVTVFGVGEAPFSLSSFSLEEGIIEISVANVGEVTAALHSKKPGEFLGIRGPYGRGFPLEEVKGKEDILFIAGGIGLAPLRPLINQMLVAQANFGKITILYGAETPQSFCFREDLANWDNKENCQVVFGVRKSLPQLMINGRETVALISGPPIMNEFAILELLRKGVGKEKIFITLERRMECGIGKCGHCAVGKAEVCREGPVFSYQELEELRLTDRIY